MDSILDLLSDPFQSNETPLAYRQDFQETKDEKVRFLNQCSCFLACDHHDGYHKLFHNVHILTNIIPSYFKKAISYSFLFSGTLRSTNQSP